MNKIFGIVSCRTIFTYAKTRHCYAQYRNMASRSWGVLNIIMFTGVQSLVSDRGIYRLGRQMIGRELVVRVSQLRNRIGI